MKKFRKVFIIAIVLLFIPLQVTATSSEPDFSDNRDMILQFLQDAFQAQVSLSEEERTREEIEEILSPYFSKQYTAMFLNENLFAIGNKYITLGSDAAIYYIPFFAYTEQTIVKKYNEKVYIYEYFPKNYDGPVGYDSHYEGIVIESIEGKWRINEFLYDNIPHEVLDINDEPKTEKIQEVDFFFFPKFLYNRIIKQSHSDLFLFKFL